MLLGPEHWCVFIHNWGINSFANNIKQFHCTYSYYLDVKNQEHFRNAFIVANTFKSLPISCDNAPLFTSLDFIVLES